MSCTVARGVVPSCWMHNGCRCDRVWSGSVKIRTPVQRNQDGKQETSDQQPMDSHDENSCRMEKDDRLLPHRAIGIVTCHADRVLAGDIVTADAAFHVAPRLFGVQSAPRTSPDCCEARYVMGRRLEFELIDVTSRLMAGHTKVLSVVAGCAIRGPGFRVDPVCKPVVQIVNPLDCGLRGLVLGRRSRTRISVEIFQAKRLELHRVVAFLAEVLAVASCTVDVQRPDAHELPVHAPEIRLQVIRRQQLGEIPVT